MPIIILMLNRLMYPIPPKTFFYSFYSLKCGAYIKYVAQSSLTTEPLKLFSLKYTPLPEGKAS